MRDPVEVYFTQLRDIRASGAGVAETSYYPALQQLLTDLGHKLKPKVTAIINLRNRGKTTFWLRPPTVQAVMAAPRESLAR